MDTNSITAALTAGDLRALVEALGEADQRVDIPVTNPQVGEPDGVVTWARYGRVQVLVNPEGGVELDVHTHHGADHDAVCWEQNAQRLQEIAAQANEAAESLRTNPRAQAAMAAGMSPALVVQMAGLIPDHLVTGPAPVPMPVMDRDVDLPGFYL